jgi:hypothetical protein
VRVQIISKIDHRQITHNCFGARVMLLTKDRDALTRQRLVEYGCSVDIDTEVYNALAAIIDDPFGYDLFVMDCDGFGGIEAAERAIATLIAADAKMRVMLVSREFDVPSYPLGRRTAVCLPAASSETNFRFGFEHVLRDRLTLHMS